MPLSRTLIVLSTLVLLSRSAAAVPYEVYVEIENEEDLYDLRVTGQLSEASFNALLLLHQTRVELNRAGRERLYLLPNLTYEQVDRIIAYREEAAGIRAFGDLVASGTLPRRLVESIRPFVWVESLASADAGPDGFVRIQGRWSGRYDRLPPAAAVQARVRAARHLDVGVVTTLTRNRLRHPRWDATRDAFSVAPEGVRLEVPKAYVEWETETFEVVAGTYRIGFGQRLTFDVTNQATPNGAIGDYELRRENELGLACKRNRGELAESPCPHLRVARVTPDYAWTNRLAGVAAGIKQVSAGLGWLQLHAWASYQPQRAQSIELRNRARCPDPRNDEEPSCAAPRVYVRGGDRGASPTASYASLPMIGAEALGGVHAAYFWNRRASLAVTGYGAVPTFWVGGVRLDYQETARKPFGGAFGAVGLSGAFGFRRQDFFAEVARSFDRQADGGGGYGVIARSVTNLTNGEFHVSARYYGSRFANPYARPISAPDELDGLRARDEAGLRVAIAERPTEGIGVRVLLDGWRQLSSGELHGLLFARGDFELGAAVVASVWTEYRTSTKRALLATRLAVEPTNKVAMSLQLQHRWFRPTVARRQRDVAGVFDLTVRPVGQLRLRARLRYDLEDLFNNHRLPHTVWLYLDSAITVRRQDLVRLRYDLRAFLDERESTALRAPNPEHWLSVEYLVRYGGRPNTR